MTTIAFIGAGNMARSLIHGLIASGHPAGNLRASDIATETLADLSNHGVVTSSGNRDVINGADVVVLAVKPQVVPAVREDLSVMADTQLLISIAAGINVHTLASATSATQPIVRCMPNTPALVGQGASALYANDAVANTHKKTAAQILEAVGTTIWVEQEAQIDAVTAVSGSGPAYFFYLMEAMIDAGAQLGLSREQATQLTIQTAMGAAVLARESDDDPAQLRVNVTSPGGTTERALSVMQEEAVADAIVRALQGAAERSAELAAEFAS